MDIYLLSEIYHTYHHFSRTGYALIELITDETAIGQRIDHWLAKTCEADLSRSRIQALIRDGHVKVGNAKIREPKTKLRGGEKIVLELPEPVAAKPLGEAIPLDILYEDDDVIVINKPSSLVVHPGNGNWTGTLVNALVYHCGNTLSGIGGVRRPGIVHRLDKDTTGVMVVAKNDNAHKSLCEQFADHGRTGALERTYQAFVWGTPDRNTGVIDTYLGRSSRDRTKRTVVSPEQLDARHAITHFTLLNKYGASEDSSAIASLIECRLETGRTHQIRVHMAHIGHPLIGDMEYGSAYKTKANRLPEPVKTVVENFSRQALHAASLTFEHPSNGKIMNFKSALPDDMAQLQTALHRLS